ncbi:hypothetical protein FRC11_000929, partial [Ceratobasidium sp. 423]
MTPVYAAQFDSGFSDKIDRGPCLEGTRGTVLDDIRRWIHNPNETKGYWVNGMAGTGKTTIAYSICQELAENGQLGASFFASSALAECSDVDRILPTIAYQLAHVSYPYRSALCRVLEQEQDVGQRKLSVQFKYLIWSPLREMADAISKGLVVVIDALDECSDSRSTTRVIELLLRHAPELPVRFLLMSRPELAISNPILSKDRGSVPVLHLHNLEEQLVKTDIRKYLIASLAPIRPTNHQIEWLAEQAGVLFIYAATLVRYILATDLGVDPKARLEAILATSTIETNKKNQTIDNLYRAILERVLQGEGREKHEVKAVERVLWTVVCAMEPVTEQTLAVLAQLNSNQVTQALRPLKSVIHVREGGVVSTLHASFPEFILDPLRSGSFYCDRKAYNQYLAIRCLALVKKHVPSPDSESTCYQPDHLYALKYWVEHLRRGTICGTFFQNLDTFQYIRLLAGQELCEQLVLALREDNLLDSLCFLAVFCPV